MMIDDDPASHIYHKIMISDAGAEKIEVMEYMEVEAALNDLKASLNTGNLDNWPDVILVDINMPVIDGWGFIAELKKMNLQDRLPKVYMVSNSESPRDSEKAASCDLVIELKAKFLDKAFFESLC